MQLDNFSSEHRSRQPQLARRSEGKAGLTATSWCRPYARDQPAHAARNVLRSGQWAGCITAPPIFPQSTTQSSPLGRPAAKLRRRAARESHPPSPRGAQQENVPDSGNWTALAVRSRLRTPQITNRLAAGMIFRVTYDLDTSSAFKHDIAFRYSFGSIISTFGMNIGPHLAYK